MNFSRRELLSASLAAGTMLVLPSLAWSVVPQASIQLDRFGRLGLLLYGNGLEAADFTEGVTAACQRLGLAAPQAFTLDWASLRDFSRLRQRIAATAGASILGLFDEASAVLIREAIRELGGGIRCSGAHAAAGPAEPSIHRLLCAPSNTGLGSALARSLAAAGRTGIVREATLAPTPALQPQADLNYPQPPLGSWPAAFGLLLAHAGVGAWRSGPVVAETRFGSVVPEVAAASRRFISLLAHVPIGAEA